MDARKISSTQRTISREDLIILEIFSKIYFDKTCSKEVYRLYLLNKITPRKWKKLISSRLEPFLRLKPIYLIFVSWVNDIPLSIKFGVSMNLARSLIWWIWRNKDWINMFNSRQNRNFTPIYIRVIITWS